MTAARKLLADIYVFVNGSSRASADELVACYDSEQEVEKSIEIYKKPFHARRHELFEKIPFIAA